MGPIEFVFLTLFLVFGIIGVMRGYGRELGVTTMLLLALFVLEFIDEGYQAQLNRVLGIFVGNAPTALTLARTFVYCTVLIVVTYISYEGETLSFPGKRGRLFFDLGSGLLNGYLFAGSLWYYLQQANWPLLKLSGEFTPFHTLISQFLPPRIFDWKYLIGLAVIMLVARIWK